MSLTSYLAGYSPVEIALAPQDGSEIIILFWIEIRFTGPPSNLNL